MILGARLFILPACLPQAFVRRRGRGAKSDRDVRELTIINELWYATEGIGVPVSES